MAYANKKRPDGRFLLFSASGDRCVVLRWFGGKVACCFACLEAKSLVASLV